MKSWQDMIAATAPPTPPPDVGPIMAPQLPTEPLPMPKQKSWEDMVADTQPPPMSLNPEMAGGVPAGYGDAVADVVHAAARGAQAGFQAGGIKGQTGVLPVTDEAAKYLADHGLTKQMEDGHNLIERAIHDTFIVPAAQIALGTLGGSELALRTVNGALGAIMGGAEAISPAFTTPLEAATDPGLQASLMGLFPPVGAAAGVVSKPLRELLDTVHARNEAIRRLAPGQEAPTIPPAAVAGEAVPEGAPAAAAPDVHTVARQIAPEVFEGPQGYDALEARKATFRGWLDELATSRDQAATADIDRQLTEARSRAETATGRRLATARAKVADLETARTAALDAAKADTPDMARVRADLQATDERMRDLAVDVSAAYRKAREQVPEAPPQAPPTAQPVGEPAPAPEPAPEAAPVPPVGAPAAAPPVDIASDITRQLTTAGRPAEEAQATGSVVESMYNAWAARYPALGSAADIYAKEGPRVEAGRQPAFAQRGRTFGQEAEGPAPVFYSALTRAIDDLAIKSAPGTQWANTIKNLKGIKQEELDWSGVQDWLRDQKGNVSKEAVQDYLAAHEVKVQEVSSGLSPLDKGFEPKFRQYTLPGGQNYRELLLTLPSERLPERAPLRGTNPAAQGAAAVAEDDARRNMLRQQGAFVGGHFDEPNVLAHVRFDERTDADGKRTLHIAEVQSDWHQKGRKQGYKGAGEITDAEREEFKQLISLPDKVITPEQKTRLDFLLKKSEAARAGVPNAPFKTTWPELAMKRMIRYAAENGYDRVSWDTGATQADRYDLSKQVEKIRASRLDNGKTNIRIEPKGGHPLQFLVDDKGIVETMHDNEFSGKPLADVIGKDMADKISGDMNEGAKVWGVKNRSSGNWSQRFASKEEAEAYHRDLPATVRDTTDVLEMVPKTSKEYSGLDLKVGGEGMKAFYDKQLPIIANKLGKKFGAKVEDVELPKSGGAFESETERPGGAPEQVVPQPNGGSRFTIQLENDAGYWGIFDTREAAERRMETLKSEFKANTAHSLPITDEMRESALQGQPLFQARRGSITLRQGQNIIRVMRDADASTAIHEFGHNWLDELTRFAARGDAPAELIRDRDTVMAWLNVKADEPIPTRAHEKFARGFERYMMEGVAPSQGLASVFAKFKDWLTQIYQTVNRLRSPITDDIRRVFDRMLGGSEERPVIAPEREAAASLSKSHEAIVEKMLTDAKAKAAHWDDEMDRVRKEADDFAALHGIESETGERASAGGEPHGGGPEGQPNAGAAGGSAGVGVERPSGGEGPQEGAGARPTGAGRGTARGIGPGETPSADTPIAPGERFVDKAWNVRLDNLNAPEDVKDALREWAMRKQQDAPMGRPTVVSDAERRSMAEGLGLNIKNFDPHKPADVSNSVWTEAVQRLTFQAADEVATLGKQFGASGSMEDWLDYSNAKNRLLMIADHFSNLTAEAGRTLRVMNKEGMKFTQDVMDQMERDAGITLAQAQREAKAIGSLETTAQRSRAVQDSMKAGFWDYFIEIFTNWLISGPATHSTYAQGNELLMLTKAVPETALQAAIGAFREHVLGSEAPRVYFGEIGAQLKVIAANNPIRTAARLAKIVQNAPDAATAKADAYALLQGSRDGVMAAARAALDGTTAKLPGEGDLSRLHELVAPPKIMPDFKVGPVTFPVGSIIRLPGRGVAVIHSYFRAVGFEQAVARMAYRKATEEGLTGDLFDARVRDLSTNLSEDMTRAAVGEATEQTLMGKGGPMVRALSSLNKVKLAGVPVFKIVNPFTHIVGAVMDAGLGQRTPLAFAEQAMRDNLLGRNGSIARDVAWSKVLFGTAVGLTGYGMAAARLQNGSGPPNPREAALYRRVNGPADHTLIGGFWYDFHRVGPIAIPFLLGANIYEVAHLMATEDFNHAMAATVFAFTQTIMDEAGMRGPSDFVRAVSEPQGFGARYVRNLFATAVVPFSVGMSQVAQAQDQYARRVTGMVDAIKNKVPWWRETLFPQVDWRGQPIPSREALGIDGLSAIYEEKARNDPTEQALLKLKIYPSQAPKKIDGITLTDQQYFDFAVQRGIAMSEKMDLFVSSPGWNDMPPAIQHDLFVGAERDATSQAEATIRTKYLGTKDDIVQQALKLQLEKYK